MTDSNFIEHLKELSEKNPENSALNSLFDTKIISRLKLYIRSNLEIDKKITRHRINIIEQ